MNAMRIPAVGRLITQCWVTAEECLRELVRNKYADRDEEIVTTLFHAELGSDDKEIIQRDIAPPLRPSLEIKIHWKDGRGPGSKSAWSKIRGFTSSSKS